MHPEGPKRAYFCSMLHRFRDTALLFPRYSLHMFLTPTGPQNSLFLLYDPPFPRYSLFENVWLKSLKKNGVKTFLGVQKMLVEKNCWLTNIWVWQILGRKVFWKSFKKKSSQKNFPWKIFGWKVFWVENFWSKETFV